MNRGFAASALICLGALTLAGCATTIPKEALQLSPEALEIRRLQTRRFDTADEKKLLVAAAGFLQDQGYTLEESETGLGVLVGSKDRDATEAGQVILGLLFGAPWDRNEKIRASVVTRPAGPGATFIRVTFQRTVWNTQGHITRQEPILDPEIYQSVFSALSKAVFLEAHEL